MKSCKTLVFNILPAVSSKVSLKAYKNTAKNSVLYGGFTEKLRTKTAV